MQHLAHYSVRYAQQYLNFIEWNVTNGERETMNKILNHIFRSMTESTGQK